MKLLFGNEQNQLLRCINEVRQDHMARQVSNVRQDKTTKF